VWPGWRVTCVAIWSGLITPERYLQRRAYKKYLLAVLMGVLAFNFVDRLALGVLLQDIKVDLHLSDTQLGVLSGIAFALFYSVMGIPIARWADRGNRVTIISLTGALWSVAVASCGLAASFAQLMLVRVGVAVGEAGGFAPGLSLIADYFSRAERPRAVAIYTLGGPLSAIGGYLLAGWLNQLYGWRVTFMLIGVPGLILAALVRLTLREPRRATATLQSGAVPGPDIAVPTTAQPSFREVCAVLWRNATFRFLLLGISVLYFFVYGVLQWQPTFFIRSFGLTSGQVGTWFAGIYGLGGLSGTYLGGELASRYAAHNERRQLVAIAIVMVSCGIVSSFVYLTSNLHVAFALLAWVSVCLSLINGPLFATIQTLVPERMRAVSIALVMLFANLIGMGLGPLATGALSDALHAWAAHESLRYALLILSPGYFLVGWLAWRASRTVTRDVAAMPPDSLDSVDKELSVGSSFSRNSTFRMSSSRVP
jgi:MFS transporter, Spinster family, sphingosine-1-phosphate transporter